MRKLLIGLCFTAILVPTLRAADVPGDQAPATPAAEAPAAAPAKPATPVNTLSIPEAVEGILDEDEPTRKKAFDRLENATEADLPALEKFEDAKDPEMKRQVALVLQRLRRGELAMVVQFTDGAPAANLKVNVKVIEVKMPEVAKPAEEKKTDGKAADAAKPAAGNGAQVQQIQVVGNGQVQVQIAGGAAGPVIVNGVPVRGQMPVVPTYKEILNTEMTTDAQGKLSLGRYNDGKYQYQLSVSDGLPNQNTSGEIDLVANSQPLKWEVRHGLNATITVVDAAGQPVVGATVVDLGRNAAMKASYLRVQAQQALRFMRNVTSGVTDEKGQAVLEGIGIYDINLLVLKEGFEPIVQDKVAAEDGKPLALSLKMEKVKPAEVTITLRDAEGMDLKGYRCIQMPQADYGVIIGAQAQPGDKSENAVPEAAKFDQYIKAGAVDLGKIGDNSQVKLTVLPGNYVLLAAAEDNSNLRIANFNYAAGMKNLDSRQLQIYTRRVAKPGEAGGVNRGGVVGIRPMPAPMPPVQNLPAPAPDVTKEAEKK